MESNENSIVSIDNVKEDIQKEILNRIHEFSIKSEKCEDNLVATVEYINDEWKFKQNNILSNDRIVNKSNICITDKVNDRIVIILESPHKDEYSKQIIAPAMGTTGENINKYLLDILNKKIGNPQGDKKEYDVILMNAIQYQTSLGIDTEYFRDRVWLTLWNKGVARDEFIRKLEDYKPDIIFNFCTNGSHKKDLIYILDKKKNSNMTYQYIDSLNLNIERKEDNNLYIGEKVVYKVTPKDSTNVYLLKGFVQTAIEESNLSSSNVKIFKGPHPSSWISKDSEEYEESFIDKIEFIK